ncbi:multiple organellar RNA editing factor 2, chloroplastic-like isoform X2 [Phoenix dactylifera]|uniref:Multiple organellar RNA editing factor 2, chloroplastic-like isoform X2 n=1 Tax=Phoenix dactylifera TaxID=42345 RepID=A0A8B7CXZ8_PHODC|nr:multiple organellar RNA editing factor 2, chloroplastic-like isoform X2 [Phoenix dactylifera]
MAIAAVARSLASFSSSSRSHITLVLTKRFFLSSSHPVVFRPSPFAGLGRLRPSPSALSRPAVRLAALGAFRVNSIRCMARRPGDSAYSPLNSGSGGGFSDRPPTEMAPLFPGCDYEHWLIVMDKPGGEGATKQQMIGCYIQTLAKVVGSEEEAKKKIYNVSCERYFGFGCEIDEETSNKLEGLPGVLFVLPDSYVDPENKDYGDDSLYSSIPSWQRKGALQGNVWL